MDFDPTFPKENDQNRPKQKPRALNPLAKAFLKALLSIIWMLKRVFYFYKSAESEKTDIIFARF
jgi:hypothetical protein